MKATLPVLAVELRPEENRGTLEDLVGAQLSVLLLELLDPRRLRGDTRAHIRRRRRPG